MSPVEIHMQQCTVGLGESPENPMVRVMRVEDPQSGIAVLIPLDQMAALQLANALSGKAIVVPKHPPPAPGYDGRG